MLNNYKDNYWFKYSWYTQNNCLRINVFNNNLLLILTLLAVMLSSDIVKYFSGDTPHCTSNKRSEYHFTVKETVCVCLSVSVCVCVCAS